MSDENVVQFPGTPIHADLDRHLDFIREMGLIEFMGDGTDAYRVTPLGWRIFPALFAVSTATLRALPEWDDTCDEAVLLVQASLNAAMRVLG